MVFEVAWKDGSGHANHLVLELCSELNYQFLVNAADHVPGESWDVHFPANRFQSPRKHVGLAHRASAARREDKVVWPSEFRIAAEPQQNGQKRPVYVESSNAPLVPAA